MGVFSREKGQSFTYGFGLPPCLFHHDLFPLRKSWFLSAATWKKEEPCAVYGDKDDNVSTHVNLHSHAFHTLGARKVSYIYIYIYILNLWFVII